MVTRFEGGPKCGDEWAADVGFTRWKATGRTPAVGKASAGETEHRCAFSEADRALELVFNGHGTQTIPVNSSPFREDIPVEISEPGWLAV